MIGAVVRLPLFQELLGPRTQWDLSGLQVCSNVQEQPWGFELGAINTPVLLWHGEKDTFSPVSHAHWLRSRLRNVELKLQSDAAPFSAIEILPQLLTWLTDPAYAENKRRAGSDIVKL